MMRTFFSLIVSVILVVLSGCGQGVPDEELGTIVYQVPKIEEADEPFELPDIPAPPGFKPKPGPL